MIDLTLPTAIPWIFLLTGLGLGLLGAAALGFASRRPMRPMHDTRCDRCRWTGPEADLRGAARNCPVCGSTWEVTGVEL